MKKEFIIELLEASQEMEDGDVKNFTFGEWNLEIIKEDEYAPFEFAIIANKEDGLESWNRRYTSAEQAILHVLNNFNENESISNYSSIQDALDSMIIN